MTVKPIGDKKELCSAAAVRERNARRSIFWMLHEAGMSYAAVGAAFGVSRGRAKEIAQTYQRMLDRRHVLSWRWSEPFAQRLRAAGAIK